MTSSLRRRVRCQGLVSVSLGIALFFALAAPAHAQQATARATASDDADRVRVNVGLELVTRSYDVRGEADVSFDAPYYPGLALELVAFPAAWFARDSRAAPLFVRFNAAKHATTTLTAITDEDDLEIPTRHDMTSFGLGYEFTIQRARLAPYLAWRATEFTLAYNPVYASSFYQGVEAGADAWVDLSSVSLGVGLGVRPRVSLGTTAREFGDDARALGVRASARVAHRTRFGLVLSAEARVERLGTRYTRRGEGGSNDAVDLFQTFVLAAGYAI